MPTGFGHSGARETHAVSPWRAKSPVPLGVHTSGAPQAIASIAVLHQPALRSAATNTSQSRYSATSSACVGFST